MKRWLCIGLVVCMLFLGGCTSVEEFWDTFTGESVVQAAEAIPRIGFGTGELFAEGYQETILSAEEVENLVVSSSDYRASLHYAALDPQEQLVYHALEYAMEQGYTNVLVDDLLIADAETLARIVDYLALDSPLLEQNLWLETGSFTTYYPVEAPSGYIRQAELTGYYITVDNFESVWWEKKQQALAKAKDIVADLPADASEAEKAEILYRYIVDVVDYEDYEDEAIHPYLYDALFMGATHCDGYTNAVSLLFRLAGLDCVEKMYEPEDENEIGHTWNCVSIDGVWYNMDAAGVEFVPGQDSSMGPGYCFAFADLFQVGRPTYAELYPACETSLYMPVDAYLVDGSSNAFFNAAKDGFNAHEREWTLIVLEHYNETILTPQLQRLADHLRWGISWFDIPLADGRTAVLVYDTRLYK